MSFIFSWVGKLRNALSGIFLPRTEAIVLLTANNYHTNQFHGSNISNNNNDNSNNNTKKNDNNDNNNKNRDDDNTELEKTSEITEKILTVWKSFPCYVDGYNPTFWINLGFGFFAGSIHTILHAGIRILRKPKHPYKRELFSLSDGGTVGLDHISINDFSSAGLKRKCSGVCILHHGLCGDSEAQYIVHVIEALRKTGKYWKAVCIVARGCGGVELTSPEGFTAHRTLDIREAILHIKKTVAVDTDDNSSEIAMFGCGFSLGAGIFGKYVGEEGKNCLLKGAVLVAPSWDFSITTPVFEWWSRHFLVKALIKYARTNENMLRKSGSINYDAAISSKNTREFDHHAVINLHGFANVDDYYSDSSACALAHNIHTPTLSISAEDDPVCYFAGRPTPGPGLVIASTNSGGHLGWSSGYHGSESWMDDAVVSWFLACSSVLEKEK